MLTREQVQSYRRDGYLLVENVLSAKELTTLRQVTDELVARLMAEDRQPGAQEHGPPRTARAHARPRRLDGHQDAAPRHDAVGSRSPQREPELDAHPGLERPEAIRRTSP